MCARAETLILRTGARVQGEILLQNEEVVIIRDASGARFQYPRAEVVEIIATEEAQEEKPIEKRELVTRRYLKFVEVISKSMQVDLSGNLKSNYGA